MDYHGLMLHRGAVDIERANVQIVPRHCDGKKPMHCLGKHQSGLVVQGDISLRLQVGMQFVTPASTDNKVRELGRAQRAMLKAMVVSTDIQVDIVAAQHWQQLRY